MSQGAFEDYKHARDEQLTRNEARRIRAAVNKARGDHYDAGMRWPFELLQNALDAGPREGRSHVKVALRWTAGATVFEHDGAPFTLQDFAALVSGGSSKEFESRETTGRFGTGFLVTHVLAQRSRVEGLVRTSTALERFELSLDRAGDEQAIMENILQCAEAITAAVPVASAEDEATAKFEYETDDESALTWGAEAFEKDLPCLFASCPGLGDVTISRGEGPCKTWSPSGPVQRTYGEATVVERSMQVVVERGGGDPEQYRCLRVSSNAGADSGVLIVLRRHGDKWHVYLPEENFPRVFCKYPLRGTDFLRMNAVLEGRFGVDQERRAVLLTEQSKASLRCALDAVPLAVQFALQEGWEGAHLLARVGPLAPSFAGGPEEREWWGNQLAELAQQLARLPLVETRQGRGPAVSVDDGWYADFIAPRVTGPTGPDETTLERVWPLVDAAENLYPPVLSLAREWCETAKDWAKLGVEVNDVTLEKLADYVKEGAAALTELRVREDAREWLVKFLDVVGECWSKRRGVDTQLLEALLPDQEGRLRSPDELWRDEGLPEPLKDNAECMGIAIRERLADRRLIETAATLRCQHCPEALCKAIPRVMTEEALITECVRDLSRKLEEGKRVTESERPVLEGSVRLLGYLWESRGEGGADIARQVPLLASNNECVRWTKDRQMMAPVESWGERARGFAVAYPPQRVLSAVYLGGSDGAPNVLPALVVWRMAIADPLTEEMPAQLSPLRLQALAEGGQDTQGVVVSGERFSQIALLEPDVLNRCQAGEEEARALLGLVLNYVAPNDPSWQHSRTVRGKRGRDLVDVRLRGALWLADLRKRQWVPVPGEDGKAIQVHQASRVTLERLLDPAWLGQNDAAVHLLSEFFGFDTLELRLLATEPDETRRRELRDGIARLVEAAGADPQVYTKLASELEESQLRRTQVDSLRRLGLAVQEAVKGALEGPGRRVELEDKGFDYKVSLEPGGQIDEASLYFEVKPYFVEVKATTRDEVRLTPAQARMASQNAQRYVLCVVDLRGVTPERLAGEWTSADVEAYAKVVPDIGSRVNDTWELVEWARTNEVSIRNESALRYGVPAGVWQAGVSMSQWLQAIAGKLAADTR